MGILYESSTWVEDWREESLNFREADNLVRRLEELVSQGLVNGCEVFMFTDNSTFQSTYYKDYSTSRKLSGIILRLYEAVKAGDLILHVIHVPDMRMKAWGVDGLSRGDLLNGMMAGQDPHLFRTSGGGGGREIRGLGWRVDTRMVEGNEGRCSLG